MKFFKPELSNHTGKAKKFFHSPMKKAIITSVAIAAIAFHTNPTAYADDSKSTEEYYVYFNDTYIGTVSDETIVADKPSTSAQPYNNMNLQIGSHIKYIPEQVFHSSTNIEQTLTTIKHAIQLKAEAAAITIDGNPVVYLENKNTARDVIEKLKLQYVSEDQLKEFEARSEKDINALPPLKENESRILNIHLSKDFSVEETKVNPAKILPVDQAVKLMQKGTIEETKYTVKDGDVLGSIASNHNLKTSDLIALNPGLAENSVLNIGQELNVTVPKPYIEVVVDKEINQQEPLAFQTEVKEDSSMPKGETKVSQEGKNGLQRVTYHISEQNGAAVTKEVLKQETLQQPVTKVVIKGTKVIPSRGEGTFGWPATGGYISSKMGYRWGKLHKGIDIARPSGLTIKAADNGVVVSAGWDNGGYGNKIIIDHQNGFRTVYAHLSSIGVSAGQTVEKGSAIGMMGATGDATGVHLHFEVYKNGALQDPLGYLRR